MTDSANASGLHEAVILLSGGLDSATCLAVAREQGYKCYCLSVDYGQRHRSELAAAANIAAALGVEHKIVSMDLRCFGGSALTDEVIDIPADGVTEGIPATYVPARNTLLLSLALGYAEVLAAQHIFIGVNAVDYSGYPDCRPEFIHAYTNMAQLATRAGVEGSRLSIHTPLMELSKAEIMHLGTRLGVDYKSTVSCYQADGAGRACGVCDSCRIRRAGFSAAGLVDSTRYQPGIELETA